MVREPTVPFLTIVIVFIPVIPFSTTSIDRNPCTRQNSLAPCRSIFIFLASALYFDFESSLWTLWPLRTSRPQRISGTDSDSLTYSSSPSYVLRLFIHFFSLEMSTPLPFLTFCVSYKPLYVVLLFHRTHRSLVLPPMSFVLSFRGDNRSPPCTTSLTIKEDY